MGSLAGKKIAGEGVNQAVALARMSLRQRRAEGAKRRQR
jgi:hypothetical protein